jgi:hypothetical protein
MNTEQATPVIRILDGLAAIGDPLTLVALHFNQHEPNTAIVLVDRGEGTYQRWVIWTAHYTTGDQPRCIKPAHFYWGDYFDNLSEAHWTFRDRVARTDAALLVSVS